MRQAPTGDQDPATREPQAPEASGALERSQRLLELSDVLTVVTTLTGQPVELDRRLAGLLGYDGRELRERLFELTHPDDLPLVRAELARLGASDELRHFEARHQRKDGGHLWLSWRAQRVGAEARIFFVATNVTMRKLQERRDADHVHTLEMAEEMTHMGWWAMDPKSGTITWSDKVYRILGRDPATFRPSMGTALSVYHPDDQAMVVEARKRAVAAGEPFRFECRVVLPGGAIRWVVSYGRPELDTAGTPTRIVGVFQDVTESVLAREATLAAARVKSQFLASMSDEMRTPLNGVMGNVQLLQRTPLTAEQREHVEAIDDASHGLLTLVDDVVDLAKIEAGKLTLTRAPFSLRQVVGEALSGTRSLAQRKGLVLSAHFADDLPARHEGDRMRVRQIFCNLIGNAVKYTPAGSVTVNVRRNPDGVVHASVRDTGVGIPPERKDDLFTPFVPADDGAARRHGGLGLAITRELCQRMDGAIWFESEVGVGTIFHVKLTLPACATATPQAPRPPASGPAPTRLSILLAEDNPVNAMVARRFLELDGHQVTLATDGQAAVEAARAQRFDVVLMDLQMPVLDGFEATRQLRLAERGSERRLPIVALNANAMKGDRDRCLEAGMDAYLTKPIDASALRRTVLELATRPREPAR